jgi:kalirin
LQEQHENVDRFGELTLGASAGLNNGGVSASGGVTNESEMSEVNSAGALNPAEEAAKKRIYVIRELVETERDYVRDLKEIVEGYMAIMRDIDAEIVIPEDLCGGKVKIIFGNMEAIYEWHRE